MASILLAEDEAVLRMLVCDTLEDEGHELDVACDGDEALEKIRSGSYDLIILDNMMPRRSGFDVLAEVRGWPAGGELRILMLTAKSQQADRDKAAQAGADDFMSKPFSPMELARKVGDMLNG